MQIVDIIAFYVLLKYRQCYCVVYASLNYAEKKKIFLWRRYNHNNIVQTIDIFFNSKFYMLPERWHESYVRLIFIELKVYFIDRLVCSVSITTIVGVRAATGRENKFHLTQIFDFNSDLSSPQNSCVKTFPIISPSNILHRHRRRIRHGCIIVPFFGLHTAQTSI